MILRQDPITKFLTLLAFVVNIYLLTFDVSFDTAFPAFLLLGGLVINRYLNLTLDEDEEIDQTEGRDILWYTMLALVGIGAGSVVASRFLFIYPASIQGAIVIPILGVIQLYTLQSMIMAVAEEQFFRGVFLQFFSVWGRWIAIVITTIIGVVYHFRVYGMMPGGLLFVFSAWFCFSYIAWKTQRLSPLICAHLINNFMASVG